jgi:hypothetical protein
MLESETGTASNKPVLVFSSGAVFVFSSGEVDIG